jgi:hypothetical protein
MRRRAVHGSSSIIPLGDIDRTRWRVDERPPDSPDGQRRARGDAPVFAVSLAQVPPPTPCLRFPHRPGDLDSPDSVATLLRQRVEEPRAFSSSPSRVQRTLRPDSRSERIRDQGASRLRDRRWTRQQAHRMFAGSAPRPRSAVVMPALNPHKQSSELDRPACFDRRHANHIIRTSGAEGSTSSLSVARTALPTNVAWTMVPRTFRTTACWSPLTPAATGCARSVRSEFHSQSTPRQLRKGAVRCLLQMMGSTRNPASRSSLCSPKDKTVQGQGDGLLPPPVAPTPHHTPRGTNLASEPWKPPRTSDRFALNAPWSRVSDTRYPFPY